MLGLRWLHVADSDSYPALLLLLAKPGHCSNILKKDACGVVLFDFGLQRLHLFRNPFVATVYGDATQPTKEHDAKSHDGNCRGYCSDIADFECCVG